jgi:serine/threonine protein kinase
MSVCLNPQAGHPTPDGAPKRLFCAVPGCGYLLEGVSISKWQISSFFARGPAALLYLASKAGGTPGPTPALAVKVLHSPIVQPVSRLEQLVQQLLALQHPGIHSLENVGLLGQDGPLYLVSQRATYGSLARHPALASTLPGQVIVALVRQIAEALHHAHQVGMVHGRLNPANCLLVEPDTIRVSDFYQHLLTETEPTFSPLYMAPEQAYDHLGPASDQYALAILTLHLLTGQVPFTGPNRRAIISQHIQNDPPPLGLLRPDLPRQMEVVIRRALSKRPTERYSSCIAFAAALEAALERRPTGTALLTPPPITPPPGSVTPAATPASFRPTPPPPPAPAPPGPRIPTGARPLSLLPGHTGDITLLRWAPDGVRLASSGADRYLSLWSMQQRVAALLTRYEVHQREVLALCWSPDSTLLATSSKDCAISLWEAPAPQQAPASAGEAAGGTPQKSWWGHDSGVTALDWSPDGARIASGGGDRTLRLWDKAGRRLAGWQMPGRGAVTALAWSPESQMLASGGAERQLYVWDPTNGSPICICDGHNDEVRHLAWSPAGNVLASAGGKRDLRVLLWNPHTGQQIGQLNGHSRPIIGLFWSPDGRWLATASADRRLRFWNIGPQMGQQVCRPIELDDTPVSMAGSADSGLVAFGLETFSILLLQLTWG